MNNHEENKKGIVLNRMYTGSYLSTNLGHEVINMFQADNGKHYLYLNAKGNYDGKNVGEIDDMLLVRYVGENKVEILAWASGLTPVPGTNMPYSKFDRNCQIRKFQDAICGKSDGQGLEELKEKWENECSSKDGIKYGKANLIDIFGEAEQQNIYITYRAEKFQTPGLRLFLEFVDELNFWNPSAKDNNVDDTFYLPGHLLGKTTLHQFIGDEPYSINNTSWNTLIEKLEDIESLTDLEKKETDYKKNGLRYKRLKHILDIKKDNPNILNKEIKEKIENDINEKRKDSCEKLKSWLKNKKIWEDSSKKIEESDLKNYKPRKISLFDIVPKLQRDENCFSDILKHFMNRDKAAWKGILENLCENTNIGEIREIVREKDATIGKKKTDIVSADSNGGRIDLLIRTEHAYVVIENKIKSDINSKKSDGIDENQLKRYHDYVKYCIIGDYIENLLANNKKEELEKRYKQIQPSVLLNFEELEKRYKQIQPSDLLNFEEEVKYVYGILSEPLPEINAYFFVLAPDYNMPDKGLLEKHGYKALYYSALVGKDNDVNDPDVVKLMNKYNDHNQNDDLWSAFYEAMKRHSYSTENQSLYEDMKDTFFARIKEIRLNQDNNA